MSSSEGRPVEVSRVEDEVGEGRRDGCELKDDGCGEADSGAEMLRDSEVDGIDGV